MEELPNWIRALIPLILLLSTIAFVFIKNYFISRKEFKVFKNKQYADLKEIRDKLNKHVEEVLAVKAEFEHYKDTLLDMKKNRT